jgi:hypothetical protein
MADALTARSPPVTKGMHATCHRIDTGYASCEPLKGTRQLRIAVGFAETSVFFELSLRSLPQQLTVVIGR